MPKENLAGRPLRLLRMLFNRSKSVTSFSIQTKQSELAKEMGITRQALNVHLRKLRAVNYIRTGRGFIDITEKGLNSLGYSSNPAFLFLNISPNKRVEAYKKLCELQIQSAYRIAGDRDVMIIVDRGQMDEVLRQIAQIEGVNETRSYIALESLK